MDENTYKLLKTAWEQGALQGIFVHFQREFYNSEAFIQGALLLKGFREHKLSSSFLLSANKGIPMGQAIPFKDTMTLSKPCSVHFVGTMKSVAPCGADKIFKHGGGTHDILNDAYEHFRKGENPVFAGGGVHGNACFRSAVTNLLNKIENSTFIAALDAVDGEDKKIRDCMREQLAKLEIDESRLCFTTVQEILEALDQIVIEHEQDLASYNFA